VAFPGACSNPLGVPPTSALRSIQYISRVGKAGGRTDGFPGPIMPVERTKPAPGARKGRLPDRFGYSIFFAGPGRWLAPARCRGPGHRRHHTTRSTKEGFRWLLGQSQDDKMDASARLARSWRRSDGSIIESAAMVAGRRPALKPGTSTALPACAGMHADPRIAAPLNESTP